LKSFDRSAKIKENYENIKRVKVGCVGIKIFLVPKAEKFNLIEISGGEKRK